MSAEAGLPASIGPYVVERLLARGGMACVYVAKGPDGRTVAVKQILPHAASDPEFAKRFGREAEIHRSLSHPNVLQLHAFDLAPSGPWLAMELVDGGSLHQLLGTVGPLPPELALLVARDVVRGLGHAHANGIVHRDVKPHNVLITRSGQVKLADFGISRTDEMTRMTATGELIGTPAYMSPEQALGKTIDGRTDLWAVGVMLHEMLVGVNPFHTGNPATTLRQIVEIDPPPIFLDRPEVPFRAILACERLLEKEVAVRPKTAEAALALLDDALADALERSAAPASAEALFAAFLKAPKGWIAARNGAAARRAVEAADRLEAGGASPESILWELTLALRASEGDVDLAARADRLPGAEHYRRREPDLARVTVLEDRWKMSRDPATLLQLGLAAKQAGDYLRTMHAFFRLRSLELEDPYLQRQVASLVAKPGPRITGRFDAAGDPEASSTAAPLPRAVSRGPAPRASQLAEPPRRRLPIPLPYLLLGALSAVLFVTGLVKAVFGI